MSARTLLKVLSHIPWGQAVENAPKVADGAARLWSTVTGLRTKTPPADEAPAPAGTSEPTETDVLRARVETLGQRVENLSEQMQASSELIKALANQNTQLVQRVELNRVRLVRLGAAATAAAIALLGAVAFLALRA
ncbi:MAG TPA: hypothetical protein VHM00_09940 [Caldimonas sp.]|jgi:hypothetical protein|nr:hypothetical protein [Caldimonas sp.]HEX2541389.1 hypothetical protein [Caldimonas sp.]